MISKICTKYIPVKISHDILDNHIKLNIYFQENIKLRYKYIIYCLLRNMIISFNQLNSLDDNVSWIII